MPLAGKKNALYFCLFWLPVGLCLFSCTKTSGKTDIFKQSDDTLKAQEDGNLLADGSFMKWDAHLDALTDWTTVHIYPGIITHAASGVSFSANTPGSYYINQRILLEAQKFYKVSVKVDYTLNDYSAAGIYLMDTAMQKVKGKVEKVYSSASGDTWQFVFYNRKPGEAMVVIGFLNGINGNALFKEASVQEYTYEPKISSSGFSSHLLEKLQLSFTPSTFDSSLSHIGDYVDMVLLASDRFYDDTVENTLLDEFIDADSNYKYFNEYRHSPEEVHIGYCQRSSLSLGEILTNEFNIPVRQIYMQFAGIGKHQFLEYWNPFSRRWIIIDPCFNVRYVRDGRLLGAEDLTPAEAPGLMTRFGSHYFYGDNLTELVALWQGVDELVVSDYFSLTFPFGSK